ncbi:hypothetical protein [Anaerotignum propionicum]|uniref:Uncharacterized protein n=1 Tax=Anaerotignum propionicum DSM 1682 TaxID=991789 RepID=A0A0X1U6X1_ANAPI|nr:hypothetical protein [Anaerotignum propionicum]AMJ40679.1 hypothetical protein CPRO_10840 [Anaerotignum propionicum DSM 1682]SHE90272.1 hypothetical protein SAMN02745151_02145 [[Clostridium] propionicum DSM 1682] [Anaerotignum propionicum DSM 1682]
MYNLQNDPVHINADRRRNESRMKREQKKTRKARALKAVATIKILSLWLFCFVAIIAFIIFIESLLQYRIILKWILIFTFTCVLIRQIDEATQKIKKSPRNGNSKRGHK